MILRLAWSQVRAQPARLVAVIAAVALSTGFLAATATFAATSREGLRLTAAAPLTRADVVLDADATVHDPYWFQAAAGVPGVRTIDPQYARTVTVSGGARRGSANVQSIAATPEVRWFQLSWGTWPAGPTQVVADVSTLRDIGVDVGARLTLRQGQAAPVAVTVTGAADLGFRPLTGSNYRFYADRSFFAGDVPPAALLTVTDRSAALTALRGALPPGVTASDASDDAEQAADRFAGGSTQLVLLMLAFAAVALLASMLVIANTFQIVVAQRIREVALLRLAGAHRHQVSRAVLAESALTGTTGALIGAAAGVATGYLGANLLGVSGGGLRVSPLLLALCVVTGVLATLVAAGAPARRASRVPPVRALADAPDPPAERASGGRRLPVGLLLTALGVVLLAVATIGPSLLPGLESSLPLALAGGLPLAAGLLIALPRAIALLLPPVARVMARLGVAAGLAAGALSQNARRTAAATMAAVVGATLITSLAVAAASGRATVDADLETRYPVAAALHTGGTPIGDETVRAMAALPGLVVAAPVGTVAATFPEAGKPTPARLAALPAELSGRLAPEFASGAPILLVPGSYLTARGLPDGSPLTVQAAGHGIRFTARASRLADTTGQLLGVTSASVLAAAGVVTVPTSVWGVAPPGFDRGALADAVDVVAARNLEAETGGGVTEGADLANVLSILLGLSLGMLGVTVVIALLGIANLLGLSVVERGRELALLRALGARRSRLRAMLAIEAVTVTLTGAMAGIVIGVPVGLAGVVAAVGRTADPVIRLPWAQLAVLLLAGMVTGVLASVVPARRATRIAPAAGLTR